MNTPDTTHPWPVYGHEWAVDYLHRGLLNGRARHAYLITGVSSIGKSRLAHAFAMALNCTEDDPAARPCGRCRSCKLVMSGNHPDLLYTETDPTSGVLRIDSIREVMRLLALKPYDARHRIALLHDFDHAQPRAQDALLKTLEEPAPHAVLILIAGTTGGIMPTITSRCQPVRLRPVPVDTVQAVLQQRGAEPEQARLLARLSSGRIGWALEALHDPAIMEQRAETLDLLVQALSGGRAARFELAEKLGKDARGDKDSLRGLLALWLSYWRDVTLQALDSPVKPANSDRSAEIQRLAARITADQARQALQATLKALEELRTNASARLVLDVMFLDYPYAG